MVRMVSKQSKAVGSGSGTQRHSYNGALTLSNDGQVKLVVEIKNYLSVNRTLIGTPSLGVVSDDDRRRTTQTTT